MPTIEPYQKSLIRLDDQTKQESLSWMSKIFLKKRIIGIGLEFVIFIKKNFGRWWVNFCFYIRKDEI